MTVQPIRILSVFVLMLLGFVFGILPLRQKVSHANREYFGMANAGAGGVFLGSGLLHMLPDAQDGFAKMGLDSYPWALLLMGCGFFSTMIIELFLSPGHEAIIELGGSLPQEKLSMSPLALIGESTEEHENQETSSNILTNTNIGCNSNVSFSSPSSAIKLKKARSYTEPAFSTFLNFLPMSRIRSLSSGKTKTATDEERHCLLSPAETCDNGSPGPFRRQAQENCVRQCWKSATVREKKEDVNNNLSLPDELSNQIHVRYYSRLFETGFETAVKLQERSGAVDRRSVPTIIIPNDNEENLSKLTAVIFVVILSLHSFITGLATGSSEASPSGYTIIFLALCVHKIVASMALGIAVKKANLTMKKGCMYVSTFAISTPSGVATGLFLAQSLKSETAKLAFTSVAMSIGSGSFVYLAIMENIVEEFVESTKNRKCKLIMCLTGFALMSGLAYFD